MKFLGKWMERENIIMSEVTQSQKNTQYSLINKWILAHKLGIPKIQFTDQVNLKKKTKVWILWSSLERGTQYPWEELQRQIVKQRLKEKPSRDCPTWRSIPYIVTKLRHYYGYQQVLADRSLVQLSPEGLYQCLTNKEVDGPSQPVD